MAKNRVNLPSLLFMDQQYQIAVIGGGASGFFGAIHCANSNPNCKVTIYEKSAKALSKVRISGGGRCNVTHQCKDNNILVKSYPRGEKVLKSVFARFGIDDTIQWFEKRGVKLKAEDDGRMFPITDNSETVIECLMKEAETLNIEIQYNRGVKSLKKSYDDKMTVTFDDGTEIKFDRVLIATGGHPQLHSFDWIADLKHDIIPPVPSLFSFNINNEALIAMQGISVPKANVRISASAFQSEGPLLITHWGLSGPAILKLSSLAARHLAEKDYKFQISVTWITNLNELQMRNQIALFKANQPKKSIAAHNPFLLPARLWQYIQQKAALTPSLQWANISKDQVNKLVGAIINDIYTVDGKTPFKDEFVTCGGVNLTDVDFKNMQSKRTRGIYFAGEVLDIDGITGGFNFQSAWTTGYIAGTSMATFS